MTSTNSDSNTPGIDAYTQGILELMGRVIDGQRDLLARAAQRMAETIRDDGRIFLFGTGHSHLLVEEAFYRAGGLAPATPIFSSSVMLHENAAMSSLVERTPGLAAPLFAGYDPRPGEMLFVISNSGVNQMPVEMALAAKEQGLFVVSISSLAYARVAPLSQAGVRLDEIADIALDNGGEPGDALVPMQGSPFRTSPSSTITGALLWNSLVTETVARLQGMRVDPPVFVSLNMPGARQHNEQVLSHWRKINPHL